MFMAISFFGIPHMSPERRRYLSLSDDKKHARANTYDILDGGWYRVVVPQKGESKKAVITVDQNLITYPRQATVQMQSGDAFTHIFIYQP